MRAIRRDASKRYASIEEMAHDLRNLNEVMPVAYHPDKSIAGGRFRQAIWLVLVLIAFGVLAQFAHGIMR